jgi:signal transduction histidine kinase
MVFIPVLLLLFIGGILFAGLRLTGNSREKEISLLWPESGSSLSLQMSLSQLRTQLDHSSSIKSHKLQEIYESLEYQGLQVAVLNKDAIIYETNPGTAGDLNRQVQEAHPNPGSVFLWDDQRVVFRYVSPKTKMVALAVGNVPFNVKNSVIPPGFKDVLETLALIIISIAVIIIVLMGIYLSRQLSEQIVQPLEKLRYMADEISKGNLNQTIMSDSRDELGDTCRAFEKMRLQLKAAKETREKYDKSRRELIAGISHDLSTPLTRVKGYTSGIIDGIANTAEKREHYLNMIYQTSISMEQLVSSLFLFSKLELGQAPFHWETANLTDYLADYVGESKEIWRSRGITVALEDTSTDSFISLDRLQFQRVIDNLIGNSLKYKDSDVGALTISLRDIDSSWLHLDFADSGVGVAPKELPKLFDSFYRTDPARSNVAGGSGLGLAIVKQIITAMHGRIWAQQTDPKGLTICIELKKVKEDTHEKNINH